MTIKFQVTACDSFDWDGVTYDLTRYYGIYDQVFKLETFRLVNG
jgi:hypothetical protein